MLRRHATVIVGLTIFIAVAGSSCTSKENAKENICPLSASKVSALTGAEISRAYVEDFKDHGFREMFGDSIRGCVYEPADYDDPCAPNIEILSISTASSSTQVEEFKTALADSSPTVTAKGRFWRVTEEETAPGSGCESGSYTETVHAALVESLA